MRAFSFELPLRLRGGHLEKQLPRNPVGELFRVADLLQLELERRSEPGSAEHPETPLALKGRCPQESLVDRAREAHADMVALISFGRRAAAGDVASQGNGKTLDFAGSFWIEHWAGID